MKNTPIICMGLLLIIGPMQKPVDPAATPIPSRLQQYWFKKAKKEILRTEQHPIWLALDNSLHFVSKNGIKQLLPFLDN